MAGVIRVIFLFVDLETSITHSEEAVIEPRILCVQLVQLLLLHDVREQSQELRKHFVELILIHQLLALHIVHITLHLPRPELA